MHIVVLMPRPNGKTTEFFGWVEIDATEMLALIDRFRRGGDWVTVTHLVVRAAAHALAQVPQLNGQRRTIDIFFITAVGGAGDLAGVKVASADQKSVAEVASEVSKGAATPERPRLVQ